MNWSCVITSLPLRPARVHGVREANEGELIRSRLFEPSLTHPHGILLARLLFRVRPKWLPDVPRFNTRRRIHRLLPQHPRALGGGRRGDGEEPEPDEKRGNSTRHCLLSPSGRTEASSASNSRTFASSPRMVSAWSAILWTSCAGSQ